MSHKTRWLVVAALVLSILAGAGVLAWVRRDDGRRTGILAVADLKPGEWLCASLDSSPLSLGNSHWLVPLRADGRLDATAGNCTQQGEDPDVRLTKQADGRLAFDKSYADRFYPVLPVEIANDATAERMLDEEAFAGDLSRLLQPGQVRYVITWMVVADPGGGVLASAPTASIRANPSYASITMLPDRSLQVCLPTHRWDLSSSHTGQPPVDYESTAPPAPMVPAKLVRDGAGCTLPQPLNDTIISTGNRQPLRTVIPGQVVFGNCDQLYQAGSNFALNMAEADRDNPAVSPFGRSNTTEVSLDPGTDDSIKDDDYPIVINKTDAGIVVAAPAGCRNGLRGGPNYLEVRPAA